MCSREGDSVRFGGVLLTIRGSGGGSSVETGRDGGHGGTAGMPEGERREIRDPDRVGDSNGELGEENGRG